MAEREVATQALLKLIVNVPFGSQLPETKELARKLNYSELYIRELFSRANFSCVRSWGRGGRWRSVPKDGACCNCECSLRVLGNGKE